MTAAGGCGFSRSLILLKQIPLGDDGRNKADDESVPPMPVHEREGVLLRRLMVFLDEETFGSL